MFASLENGPTIYLTYSRQRQSRKVEVIADVAILLALLASSLSRPANFTSYLSCKSDRCSSLYQLYALFLCFCHGVVFLPFITPSR